MNIIKLINELNNQFSNFQVHPDLITDLIGIIGQSGNEKAFTAKLKSNLNFLNEFGIHAHIQSTNQFEKIKDYDNMYSMHIQNNTFNVRILYSFMSDGTILLHGFDEKSGKKTTDYTHAVPIAIARLRDYSEEDKK